MPSFRCPSVAALAVPIFAPLAFAACGEPAKGGPDDTGGGSESGDTGDTAPCTATAPEYVDWMAFGDEPVGVALYSGETTFLGAPMPLELQLTYPATVAGEDAPVAAGAHPVVFFEHAYGSFYTDLDWLFTRLASRGFVVVSAAHNGAWDGTSDWWGAHASLFADTIDTVLAWNADAASPWYGRVDADHLALMGHSHGGGAALRVMRRYAPMDATSPIEVDAVVLITVRPDLDGALDSYHATYDGMPPLLNVAASRDEDGTTAYGTSIAVYEPDTRPKAMVYVEGANHYVFTDESSVANASITREAGQAAGGAAIVAFLEDRLRGDARGWAGLRGEVALTDGGAPTRWQVHDAGTYVIDDFEAGTAAEGAALVGIPGQTFVNGFLGDTFVDFEAGVAVFEAEVTALLPDGGDVLFFEDASRGPDAYGEALARLEADGTVAVRSVTSAAAFVEALATFSGDLVVAAQQDGSSSAVLAFDAPLAEWVCGGGKAILSDFRVASTSVATTYACAGAAFDGVTNYATMTSTGTLFSGSEGLYNPGWGIYSMGLLTPYEVYATDGVTSDSVHDPATSPVGAVTASGAVEYGETRAWSAARALYMPTWAAEVAWTGDGSVTWALPAVDATPWQVLSLRLLAVHADPLNPEDAGLDLTVVIEDAAGVTAAVALSAAPGGALGATPEWLAGTTPKSVFETRRIPLSSFVAAAPDLDLAALTAVSVRFDRSPTGRLLVDDLELAPGLGCP